MVFFLWTARLTYNMPLPYKCGLMVDGCAVCVQPANIVRKLDPVLDVIVVPKFIKLPLL